MGFKRQLDALMAVLAGLTVFAACILTIGMSIKISFLISVLVFLAGLTFGRRVAEVVTNIV